MACMLSFDVQLTTVAQACSTRSVRVNLNKNLRSRFLNRVSRCDMCKSNTLIRKAHKDNLFPVVH